MAKEKFKKYQFFKKYTHDNKKIFLELLSLGWPIGIMILVEKGIQLIDAVMAGSINQNALAAQEITSQFVFFPIVLAYGLSRGGSIAISKAKELAESKRITKVGIGTSLAIFLPVLVVYNSMPKQLVSVFSNNSQLQPYAKNLFIVNTLGGVLDSKRISTTACLRGLKETKFPLKTTTLCLIFSLLISYLLGFQTELGVDGIYLGRNVGLLFASLSVFFGLTNKLNEANLSPFPHYTSIKAYFFSPKLQIANDAPNDLAINAASFASTQ